MKPKVQKLNLESYDDFVKNPAFGYDFLSNHHLNKIIQMHGFSKLHKRTKNEILEALSKMKLLNPRRSTLNVQISTCVTRPTVDQVNDDLGAIGWQECTVQSVEDLCLAAEDNSSTNLMMDFGTIVTKPRSKRKRKAVNGMEGPGYSSTFQGIDDCVHHDVDSLLAQLTSGPLA